MLRRRTLPRGNTRNYLWVVAVWFAAMGVAVGLGWIARLPLLH